MKSNCSEPSAALTQEITMNAKIKSTAMAVALAGLFAAQPAAADTLTFNGFSNGSVAATIYNTPSPVGGNPTSVAAGGFSMTNATAGGTFQAWCVDIFSWMVSSTNYTFTTGAALSTLYTSTQITALERLASNNLASVTSNPTNSAAFQLAAWEIVNERSGTYNVSNGNFYANSAAAATANSMLSNLGSATPTMTLSVWKESTYPTQDLAVFAPVPEPQTYAMMLAGLGLMGFVARRRQQMLDSNDA